MTSRTKLLFLSWKVATAASGALRYSMYARTMHFCIGVKSLGISMFWVANGARFALLFVRCLVKLALIMRSECIFAEQLTQF